MACKGPSKGVTDYAENPIVHATSPTELDYGVAVWLAMHVNMYQESLQH
jgi:hypothetical protein